MSSRGGLHSYLSVLNFPFQSSVNSLPFSIVLLEKLKKVESDRGGFAVCTLIASELLWGVRVLFGLSFPLGLVRKRIFLGAANATNYAQIAVLGPSTCRDLS